jgi:hypothetical protein
MDAGAGDDDVVDVEDRRRRPTPAAREKPAKGGSGKFTLAAVASTISAFVAVFGANWFNAAKLNIDQADLAMRYAQFARGEGGVPPDLEEKVFVMNAMAAAGFGGLAAQARREARDAQVRHITDVQLDEPVHPSLNIGIPGLTVGQLETILAFVSVFERGSIRGDYSAVSANSGDAGGIVYGIQDATLTNGGLYSVIAAYVAAEGAEYVDELRPYLDRLKTKDKSLAGDKTLLALLGDAGQDPVMQSTQLAIGLKAYFAPSFAKARQLGLRHPLSYAVVYDSIVNSGRLNTASRADELVGPLSGTNEKEWIAAYVTARREWMTQHFPQFPQLALRMQTFESLIAADNWSLTLPVAIMVGPDRKLVIRREDLVGDALVRANTDAVLKDALASDPGGQAGFFEKAGASLDAMFNRRKPKPPGPSVESTFSAEPSTPAPPTTPPYAKP